MDLENELRGFSGSTVFYMGPLGSIRYTEGIRYLADRAGAFWLVDLVGSYQPQHRDIVFQLWKIRVRDNQAIVSMREDCGEPAIVEQEIPYTDFPLDEFEFYVCNGMMMLKSEY